ncbi:hypothetical protein Bca4012_026939 [Brassica carinata]
MVFEAGVVGGRVQLGTGVVTGGRIGPTGGGTQWGSKGGARAGLRTGEEALLVMMGEECFGGRIVKLGSLVVPKVSETDPGRGAVEPNVKLGFTVVGTVARTPERVVDGGREGERGGKSVREDGGSEGFGGSPPGADDRGFRTVARPSEESQQFASEDILFRKFRVSGCHKLEPFDVRSVSSLKISEEGLKFQMIDKFT